MILLAVSRFLSFAKPTVMPPDALFGRQIRIERLCDGGPERVENARILFLPGRAFELQIQALRIPARELGDRMNAEGRQIPFDGGTD
jgi:hypothetical protein